MYKDMIDIISNYIYKEKDVDKDFFYDVYFILAEYLNIDDKINGIIVDDTKFDSKYEAIYSPSSKIILASLYPSKSTNKLINASEKMLKNFSPNYLRILLTVQTLIHEMNHAVQFSKIENGENNLIDELISKSNHITRLKDFENPIDYIVNDMLSQKVYDDNHDLSPAEIEAEYLTDKSLEELFLDLDDLDYSKVTLEQFKAYKDIELLLSLYKKYKVNKKGIYTNSPSYDYCNMARNKDEYKPEIVRIYNENKLETFTLDRKNYSLDERLQYGLQLTNFELLDYESSIKKKIKKETDYVKKYKR